MNPAIDFKVYPFRTSFYGKIGLMYPFCSFNTCVDYVIYPPKLENDTIKIGYFMHKCKFSTFIIVDGYRMRINRTSIKVIISLNLSASNTKTL